MKNKLQVMIQEYCTIPTVITAMRLCAAPFVFKAIVLHRWEYASWGIGLSFVSDIFDGYFARKFKQETIFGACFDTVVDKILIVGCLAALWHSAEAVPLVSQCLPKWFMGIVIGREVLLLVGGALLFCLGKKIVVSPTMWGKGIGSIIQIFVLAVFLAEANFFGLRQIFELLAGSHEKYTFFLSSMAAISLLVFLQYASSVVIKNNDEI